MEICIDIRRRSALFVKFSRSKKNKFVKLHVFEKKIRKIWKIEKLREKYVAIMELSSPIRMTLRYLSVLASIFFLKVTVG